MGAIGVHFGMPQRLITIAETPLFMRQAEEVWDDTEREAFVNFIAWNPEAGDVIPETGGVRKVRWSRSGKGRRGGARVIYFYHNAHRPLYLLMVYAKARREDLTPDEKRTVRKLAALLKGQRE
jgi:mRNA-degrading endonuclease RelE of RelBE toxin-antitoxin system